MQIIKSIQDVKNDIDPSKSLELLLTLLHKDGPVDNSVIECVTYYKIFHAREFSIIEKKLISVLGLFYKNKTPEDLYSFILSGIGRTHKDKFGEYLTPVQASIRNAVETKQYVSISAPTSAGKSFSIRDYILESNGDTVIIVPSRALIAEYIKTMKDMFNNNKSIMISSFVDSVFTARALRRIFVLTPERSRELFSSDYNFTISLFFLDEAQVSEEKERGVIFDVLIRRIQKIFSSAKLVFAHPFVDNPDAQVKKHDFDTSKSFSRSYSQNTVGKVFVFSHKTNDNDYFFSPFTVNGHLLKKAIKLDGKFESFAFSGDKSVLVFVSKLSLYDGRFIEEFEKHIDNFEPLLNKKATEIIKEVEELLGANDRSHRSNLVDLLKVGVVIHHGSVPLEVRFLVEDFIRGGFAKICFATSTLAQGINMPFDIVWLSNMRMQGDSDEKRSLAFKNLIGRSGRLTKEAVFDYGYVYTKNPGLLTDRINTNFKLSEESILDSDVIDDGRDESELICSIANGTFDEEINLPLSKIERLSSDEITSAVAEILRIVYKLSDYRNLKGDDNKDNRDNVKHNFRLIYEASIGRPLLNGEGNVFDNAIAILFHVIQGKSFKEIVGIRYNYISRRDGNRNDIAKFTQPANKLPDSTLINAYSLFNNIKAKNVSYDTIVFDTYDYLDTVISFSLTDVFIGAFSIYHKNSNDEKAIKMIKLLKYGTNNHMHIMLMRYGFPPEEVSEIEEYVESVSEEEIVFNDNVSHAPKKIKDLIEWYLP